MRARTLYRSHAREILYQLSKKSFCKAETCGDFRALPETCGYLRSFAETSRSLAETSRSLAELCGDLRRLRGALRSFAETCATIYLLADDVNCTSRLPYNWVLIDGIGLFFFFGGRGKNRLA